MTELLVGYRVDTREEDGTATATDDEGRRVRLARIRDGDAAGERSVTAWLAAEGDHLQRVLDLGTAPNGDLVAVLEELPHALADLVAARPLEPGEAVTVLVPVAEALAALHAAGVAHGAVGVPAIALTPAGAPVLLLPRTARTAGPGDPALAEDRRALAALARRLLPPPVPDALLRALEQDPGGAGADALFTVAEPAPVRLGGAPGNPEGPATPARLVAPVPVRPPVDPPAPTRPPASVTRPPGSMTRARRLAAGVRPRVWVTAAVSVSALVAALVLLPGSGTATAGGPAAAPSHRPTTAAPRPASTASGSPPTPADPVAAPAALLAERSRCLTTASTRCLDAVDAAGSPVDGLDRAALLAGVEAVRPPALRPVLLRRAGATAVLAVGPCTVLAIRGPDGWRLRDVLAPAPGQMPSEPVKSPSSSRARTAERKRAASAPSTIRWS
ncbi:MAG: hypothetical protein ACTHJL_03815 [Amnibacterium sp.]